MRHNPLLWIPIALAASAALLAQEVKAPPGAPGQKEAAPPAPAQAEGAKVAPGEAGKAAPALPPGVLARLNGQDITVEAYTTYLFATMGKSKLREFIDRLLIEEEGKQLKVEVSPEEVEARVTAQIESSVRALHQNSMEKFLESLTRRNLTLEEHKQKLRQETAYRLLEEKCILSTRKVTEEDIAHRFEQVYGEGGVQYELRHILISTRPRSGNPGEPRPAPITDQEARAKAEKVLKELQAGADFVQLVKTYSDDELTKRNDGRIPLYRKGYRGPEFHEAVGRLSPENRLSGVVKSQQGYHLLQLIDRKTTRLEDKREELRTTLQTQMPTQQERISFLKALRAKAKIEM